MSWARTVAEWNRSSKKVIIDAGDVYALPLKNTPEYKVVKELYEHKREKDKKKEIEAEEKREVLKPAAAKVEKFMEDINKERREKALEGLKKVASETAERNKERKREKALEGLKKVEAEAAERNKQRKREAAERAMMAGEDIKPMPKKKSEEGFTREEAAELFDTKYVDGYEFKDRKDMAIAVRALRAALPDATSTVDRLAQFFMKKGFTGKEYEIAFRKGAGRPGKTFVQDALNNRV